MFARLGDVKKEDAGEGAKPIGSIEADQPITTWHEDVLGRAPFARRLADALRSWDKDHSLVVGLCGPWGNGKSSIKNMALEHLRGDDATCPDIVEFNPWQITGHDQLASAFFREVGLVLKRGSQEDRKVAKRWERYTSLVQMGTAVAAAAAAGGWIPASVVLALDKVLGFIRPVHEWLKKKVNRSLHDVRADLVESLRQRNKSIVVVVDDLDRLDAEEVRLMLKLVKANASLPRFVYLLLFDRIVVEHCLDSITEKHGASFLEKIVQLSVDVPRIDVGKVHQALFAGLDELLGAPEFKKDWDRTRWGNVFIGGLKGYFADLRDVKRYLNSVRFHLPLFLKDGVFEVNAIDFLALEALRLFEPRVYRALMESKEALTQTRSHHDHQAERVATQIKEIVELAAPEMRPAMKEIITELFPQTEWAFGGTQYGSDFFERWFRERRVSNPDQFEKYFLFALPEQELSEAGLQRIITLAGNRQALLEHLRSLQRRGLLAVAMDRLEHYKQEIPFRHAEPFLTAIFDVSDDLPTEGAGFTIDAATHAYRVGHWFLMQEKDADKRFEALNKAMQSTSGLYMPCRFAVRENDVEERKKNPSNFLTPEDKAPLLKEACLSRIRAAVDDGRLHTSPHVAAALYRWRDWGNADEMRKWVHNLIQSDAGLLIILAAFTMHSTSQTMGDRVLKDHWRMSLKDLEQFADISVLSERVPKLQLANLSEEYQRAVQAFLRAIERRRQGKPDESWRDDDD